MMERAFSRLNQAFCMCLYKAEKWTELLLVHAKKPGTAGGGKHEDPIDGMLLEGMELVGREGREKEKRTGEGKGKGTGKEKEKEDGEDFKKREKRRCNND
jgi:hypothetical protein